MAIRLSFDLALHVDMAPYVAKKSLTQEEANVRRDVFWGAFAIDQYVKCHLNPSTLQKNMLRDLVLGGSYLGGHSA